MTKRAKQQLLKALAARKDELDMTDYELGQVTGLPRSTIQRMWLRGELVGDLPSDRVLDAVAKALGMKVVMTLEVVA